MKPTQLSKPIKSVATDDRFEIVGSHSALGFVNRKKYVNQGTNNRNVFGMAFFEKAMKNEIMN